MLKVGDGQGGLACCDSQGRKESDIGYIETPGMHIQKRPCEAAGGG